MGDEKLSEALAVALDYAKRADYRPSHMALERWSKRAAALEAECERLHTWAGLMSLLDEHWPEDIIPTLEDDAKRDAGARIVSLLRWLARERAECERLRGALERLSHAQPDGLDHSIDIGIIERVGRIASAALTPTPREGEEKNT